jgi:formamidopyrimidine-DNA glycosylase
MPELPEVETIRRQLAPAIEGRRVVATWTHPAKNFVSAAFSENAVFDTVRRRGKYLIVATTDGRELIVHLGMTGSLRIQMVPTEDPYVRVRWTFDNDTLLEFRDIRRFGRVQIVERGDYRTITTLHTMGPEPLSKEFTGDSLYSALRTSRRPLKSQLLSQRPVAGVGNIYADEALWRAQIHPSDRRVSRARSEALAAAITEVLTESIERGGTTFRDYRDANGQRGTNQLALAAYGRGGQPCSRCGETLRSFVLDQRTTTYCPRCQPRRR